MKRCTGKSGLITVCVVQLLATVEREVFDFLGYMWLPIIANFLQLIAVIFGFFGAYQHRIKYLVVYAVWAFIWLCWNIFVICFYLEVGRLRRSDEVLSLYTGSVSFWEASGPGCVPVYSTNGSAPADPYREPRPDRVDGCWLDYEHVEALHAALQILLAAIGVVLAGCLIAGAQAGG
ncbi:sodium/potassium-transporting ATPase subunit beta-1-interacting protein-like [Pollicipes pollicipes]|uniref:sodium/potassium-transporting ATPase subunit beta-1-interacting protein-like n=1 Tax=Pollicipes pollicipes TaxID=41117 RepID=UPI001884CEA9|nr:sodium/potassium-transporting ATPase subunit beta-1-interacting protein-like [Pollicipes pollicipes]